MIEGPLETSAIMDSSLIRFAQDQRGEELRLGQGHHAALRKFWILQKQKLKPIAESVEAVLLPYQVEYGKENPLKRAVKAQKTNEQFIHVLDDDWPPVEANLPKNRQISWYMGDVSKELFRLCKNLVNVKYDSEDEDAEAEIKPIKDLIKLMEVSNC